MSDDIIARIEALEQAVQQPLDLSQLPLGDLQRQLENNWQPDAASLLQPYSITSDQLAAQAVSSDKVSFPFLQKLTAGMWLAGNNHGYGAPAYWDFNLPLVVPDASICGLTSAFASVNNVIVFNRACKALVFANCLAKALAAGARSDMSLRKNNTRITSHLGAATPDGFVTHTCVWAGSFVQGDLIGPVLESGGNEYDVNDAGQWSTMGVLAAY